ncbi:hypothetical protein VitviT2T_021671 [Vitis vinifera]|uniref:DUF1985 domain-containing protein n=2 Tax=Vitis vinifera TaxID=29760 RepID=A0ABY9D938_VITVI|nr:hypothetical protein VitviT2T_021671 [Vitis vinifera]
MFRKSCFGHFLLLPELRFSAQIVHQLLLRQCETKKDNEIWILLKSKGLRFSKEEFALITGLSFGPITKCDKKSLRIRDTYFKGENKVRNDELEKVFLSLGEEKKKKKNKKNKKKGFEDEEVIKLALLYFLEHVLFGKEGKNLIDMEWVALVDNLEAFNKYPWGGICYERTLFGLQRALENRVSKYQDKKKTKGEAAVEAYSLVGFPYAFQVWAYEAIPLIGLKYATRVSERYPRILNWSATSAPRSTEVENVFLEPHLTFHSLLTPTLEEQQQDYYKHVDKQGASAEMLHQSNASQDAKNDDLRHEKSSSDTAAYVAAATAAMAEETTNDAITPSIEKLWMEFVKFRQSSELNFNHLKKEIEGLNLKMDELKQLLLEVSDMFTCLNFLILQCFDICVFSYLLLLGGVCNFRLRV